MSSRVTLLLLFLAGPLVAAAYTLPRRAFITHGIGSAAVLKASQPHSAVSRQMRARLLSPFAADALPSPCVQFALQELAALQGRPLPVAESAYGGVVKDDENKPKSRLDIARAERRQAEKDAAEACKGTNKCVVRGETRGRRNGDW